MYSKKFSALINFVLFTTAVIYKQVQSATVKKSKQLVCDPVDDTILTGVLGNAYNSRYMSFDDPDAEIPNESEEERNKRKSNGPHSFYVDENYNKELDIEPKWPWDKRRKRSSHQQWECESKMRWIDLGMDYFPRYIRSVECSGSSCWFGKYKCKPKSFAIKLLRRKRDRCVVAKIGTSVGMEGLPLELRELWVWEERAINFCCECSL